MKTVFTLLLALCGVFPYLSSAQLRNPVNILLNFCGKVVDQEGKPVVGAKVNLEA